MDASWLSYCITGEQMRRFEEEGYLVVEEALPVFGYSYRWLRGLDYNVMPEALLAKCDPIRRQLLGDGVTQNGWWQPREEDVPLRAWLREHRGEEYVK
jgi:hypothetical protein